MSKDLRFNILVRENFNRALSAGRSALRGFVGFAGGIARRLRGMLNLRNILVGGGIIGGSIAGLKRLAKAYGEQEAVDRRLAASFGATGKAADAVIKKWGDFATGIQRVTTLGDEEIMMLIALAKNMGVADEQMEQATKGAIGLSKAFGMDLNTAMKGVAMALQGEFTMLSRYIPALRTAGTEAEKMAILQKAMASGFNIAKAELGTINGMWAAFKGVIGDALQSAGKGLFGGGGLIDGIRKLKERVIELTESGAIEEWAKKGAAAAKTLGDILGDIFSGDQQERAEALGDIGRVIKAIFQDAATIAKDVLVRAAPLIGTLIAKAASAAMDALQKVKEVDQIRREFRDQGRMTSFQANFPNLARNNEEIEREVAREYYRRMQARGEADLEKDFPDLGEGRFQTDDVLREMQNRRKPDPVYERVSWEAGEGMGRHAEVGEAATAVAQEAEEKSVAEEAAEGAGPAIHFQSSGEAGALPGVNRVGGFDARLGAEIEVQRQMREEGKLGRFGVRADAREEFDRRAEEAAEGAGPAIHFQSSGEAGALSAALREMQNRRAEEAAEGTGPAIHFQSSGEAGALSAALREMQNRRAPKPVWEEESEPADLPSPGTDGTGGAATEKSVAQEAEEKSVAEEATEKAVAQEAAEKSVAAGQLSLGEIFGRINDGTAERLQRQANDYLHMIVKAMSTETQV